MTNVRFVRVGEMTQNYFVDEEYQKVLAKQASYDHDTTFSKPDITD